MLGAGAAADAQPDVQAALSRLGAYVEAWERDLGSVVADEHYEQAVSRQPRSELSRERLVPAHQTRRLVAEFTLIRLDDGPTDWVGFRCVTRVDGVSVQSPGPSLQALLREPQLTWRELGTAARSECGAQHRRHRPDHQPADVRPQRTASAHAESLPVLGAASKSATTSSRPAT